MASWVIFGWALVPGVAADGKPSFVEVGANRGIESYDAGLGYGAGVSIADFDEDGDLDLFVPNGPGVPDQLYRNHGDASFEEVAAEMGVAATSASRTALWVDFNGDGRLDLVVAGDCYTGDPDCLAATAIRFYAQRADRVGLDDVTATYAPAEDDVQRAGEHRSGLVAGDLNRDGWLDLVVGLWQGGFMVLMNDGGQRFVDVAASTEIVGSDRFHWQPTLHDFNGDGWLDLHWAMDYTANHLWMNDGDGTFTDVAPELGLDNAMNDMGTALGDYDNDGDLDLYITEIATDDLHNVLFRNDSTRAGLAFTETAIPLGVSETGFAWGTTFFDANNDGWLDLAVTNGWFNGVGYDDPSRLFLNDGGTSPAFTDVSKDSGFNDREWGAGLVAGDLDRDGDQELIQTCRGGPVRILDNVGRYESHFLVVRPRSALPNRYAIGAVVRAEAGDLSMMRRISAGTSHLGQEAAEAHFGLGPHRAAARVTVEWPDGAQSILVDVGADRIVDVERSPCAGTADLDGDGMIGFRDLVLLLSDWGACSGHCPEDVDANREVDALDLQALLTRWGACPRG